ncbi:MAG: 30S ribosomal protein S9 [bacterium]|nr:30S ribosomal protein S9 [bacterium]
METETKGYEIKNFGKRDYVEAVGRRKTSVARVRIYPSAKATMVVNNKDVNDYFSTDDERTIARDALSKPKVTNKFKITAKVSGGGTHSQAEALRHGIARALIDLDHELRKTLKKMGYLKRDPRMKERRKFGLKKARKAPQWSKR